MKDTNTIHCCLAHDTFQIEQKIKPLLVRDGRKRIIGIAAFEIDVQLGELVAAAVCIHRAYERVPARDGFQMHRSAKPIGSG